MIGPGNPVGRRVAVSFEFFPPTDPAMEALLWRTVQRLAPFNPRFVSVTYGADGSARERTHHVVTRVHDETELTVAPHITCNGESRKHITRIARRYWDVGIRRLVALRGDATLSNPRRSPTLDQFKDSVDLVDGLLSVGEFEISVAAYPEVHPEAASAAADLGHLKRKLEAGATRAITQFFFDTDVYLRFRDAAAAAGIDAPLVPGILPITGFPQVLRFARRCGASIPGWLAERFQGLDKDAATRRAVATAVAVDQVERLRRHGVDEFHFYTLNRSELTYAICDAMGIARQANGLMSRTA